MISLLTVIVAFLWIGREFRRNPAFFLVAIFLTWQFALKMLGVLFLDTMGPIYSDEVGTEVGGVGSSAPLMVLFVLIPIFAIKTLMNRTPRGAFVPRERHLGVGGLTLGDAGALAFYLFLTCLFVDLFRIGQIPFFTGQERFEYKGGIFHEILFNYVFLIAYLMGFLVARGRILTGKWDLRYAVILLTFFVYLFLTGHRFGSFYVMISFGAVPMAGILIAPRYGVAVAPFAGRRSQLQRLATSKPVILSFSCCLVAIVLIAMANSLLNVRDNDVHDALLQRFLVQPVHLYWLTFERLQNNEVESLQAAMHFMFNDPFDASRNTGIQYLMLLHLGLSRASQVYEGQVVDYAGGYPEILIELGGVGLALVVGVFASVVVAVLYKACAVSVARGRFLTGVMSMYVCYGILNFFLGGMMNFVTVQTYWIKIAVLIGVYLLERASERQGRRLIPWILVPAPRKTSGRTQKIAPSLPER